MNDLQLSEQINSLLDVFINICKSKIKTSSTSIRGISYVFICKYRVDSYLRYRPTNRYHPLKLSSGSSNWVYRETIIREIIRLYQYEYVDPMAFETYLMRKSL